MAGATVIDQLIVKLGLDPKDFNKGQKEAAAAIVSTENTVRKSSESMGRSVMGFTGKLLGVATAAVAVKKAATYVSDLSTRVRDLGNNAKAFGLVASEFRNFQNIGEMMGGKPEEVTRSIGNLSKAVYDLAYNGQISDSLIMLGRLGVQFQDTAGKARPFRDIVLDTEQQIQRLLKTGTSYENAGHMLAQAGFDPGLSRAILEGTVGAQLAQQEARRQVSGDTVKAATDWEKSATNRDQAIAAATLRTLPTAAKGGIAANDLIANAAEGASDLTLQGGAEAIGEALSKGAEAVKEGATKLVDSLGDLGDKLRASIYPTGRGHYEQTIQDAARKHGVDPEMLAGVLATESNFDPSAVSPAGAKGIAQLMPKYFPNAGKNPHEDIDTAAGYLREQFDSFKRDGMSDDDAYWHALQSYNAGQSRVRKSMQAGGKPLAQETLDYPGKVLSYASAGPSPGAQGAVSAGGNTSSTEVNIGKVDVYTQATDADGIAKDFAGATRRKVLAAQADTGMQ